MTRASATPWRARPAACSLAVATLLATSLAATAEPEVAASPGAALPGASPPHAPSRAAAPSPVLAASLAAPGTVSPGVLPPSVEITRPDEPIVARPGAGAPRRGAARKGARLPVYAVTTAPGCAGSWFSVGPLAWVCEAGAAPSPLPPTGPEPAPSPDGLPHAYHFVGPDGSFGYRTLETAEEGVPDAQLFPGFGVAITRVAPKPGAGEPFALTTHRFWVPARDLGGLVRAPEPLASELGEHAVAWVTVPHASLYSKPGGAKQPGAPLDALTRVVVLETSERRGESWLRIGDAAWLRARDTTSSLRKAPPAEVLPGERWLDVDLTRQVLTAYRGTEPLFALPVSTGRGPEGTELATPKGTHRLWIKLESSDMDNLEAMNATRNYAIQAVPWVMYFDRGYGLHGTFWHHAFGHVRSHGCVNLTPADARRVFDWTSPRLPAGWSAVFPTSYERGTLVRVE